MSFFLRNKRLHHINSKVRDELALAYSDLTSLVGDVAIYYRKRTGGTSSDLLFIFYEYAINMVARMRGEQHRDCSAILTFQSRPGRQRALQLLMLSSELSFGSVSVDFTGLFGRKIDDFNRHKTTIVDILWSYSLKNVEQSKSQYLLNRSVIDH